MQNMKRSATVQLIKFLSILFAIFAIVDSILHIVHLSNNFHNNDSSATLMYLMSIRIVVSAIAVVVTFKETSFNFVLTVTLALLYGVVMTVILFVTAVLIDYRHHSLSLIVQIIATYLGIATAYKLVVLRFVKKQVKNLEEKENFINIKKSSAGGEEFNGQKSNDTFTAVLRAVDNNILALSTLFTVCIAIALGTVMKEVYPEPWEQRPKKYVGFIGELFFRMLKCLILPLIFTSLVFAMANIDSRLLGRVGLRTFCYYLTTTVAAIVLGIVLVLIIRPGKISNVDQGLIDDIEVTKSTTEDSILDLLRNVFPDNIITACFQTYKTVLVKPVNMSDNSSVYEWNIQSDHTNSTNILGIVVFAIVLGVIIGRMNNSEGQVLIDFFRTFINAIMAITGVVIQLTPIAVLFLVLPQILDVDNVGDLLASVGLFTLTTIVGLIIHGFLVYPLLYFLLTRKNPYVFMARMSAAIITAFGTSSSSVTMPVTIQCLEERNHIDKRIVRFCVPLGASINMDGGALYYAVAAIFIAQYRNIELSFATVVVLAIIATAVSVGAAGIPTAGPVTIMIVLNSVGLPVEDATLVFVVDWILDRCETAINVMGDSFGAGIIHHLSKDDLLRNSLPIQNTNL